jgi:uncharacterized surface protein with fasciclin (FAS1) repeats
VPARSVGQGDAAEVVKLNEAKTLNGKMLKVTVKGSTVMINTRRSPRRMS